MVLFKLYFDRFCDAKEEFMGWWQIMNQEECGTSQDMLMISSSPFTSTDTSSRQYIYVNILDISVFSLD